MTEAPTFAKVGGPPADWRLYRVFDAETGLEIRHVIEVDTSIGYLLKHVLDERGQPVPTPDEKHVRIEHLTGKFRLEKTP